MFGVLPAGVRISEHFDNFVEEVLLEPKPVQNWPSEFGKLASQIINARAETTLVKTKVLMVKGGPGRSTLELLRDCQNLHIDHLDPSADHVFILDDLLKSNKIQWDQPIEGKISKKMNFELESGESGQSLLDTRGNVISYVNADVKDMFESSENYNVIVADIRHRNAADDIALLCKLLDTKAILILGSIDDMDEDTVGEKHSRSILEQFCERLPVVDSNACFPHIYRETRNKHQYAMSYFSVWRLLDIPKHADVMKSHSDGVCPSSTEEYYEDDSILNSYDIFHFGEGLLSVENFPLQMANVCMEACKKFGVEMKQALDAGCGPGRTAIELCSSFEQVLHERFNLKIMNAS